MRRYEGNLIFEGKDDCGTVEVVDTRTLRTLHFGTPTIQSSMYLDDPIALEMEYLRKMALALVFNPQPQRVLCLGMGGGCLPKFFWTYYPDCQIDAVDFSPLVIEVSYRFFQLPRDPRLRVYPEEALQFLMSTSETYDFIFADLFVSDGISPVIAHPSFFEACKLRLQDHGLLVWNMWTSTARETQERTLEQLGRCFGNQMILVPNQESANYILMLFNGGAPVQALKNIKSNAQEILRHTGLNCPEMLKEMRFSSNSR